MSNDRFDFKCHKCGSRECVLIRDRDSNFPLCANCLFDERDRLRAVNAELVAVCRTYKDECPCNCGGFGGGEFQKQPCDLCDRASKAIALATGQDQQQ
jgi:hypothetical protein